jgi:hypothetical protein
MKSILITTSHLLLTAVFLFSCTDQDGLVPDKTNVSFSATPRISRGAGVTEFPQGASLMISVESANGNQLLDQQEIKLQDVNEGYISLPVKLLAGDYVVTQFMVLNKAGEVIYAAPLKGSELATLADATLPYTFKAENDALKIEIPVLNATQIAADKFGYDSFKKKASAFKVEVLIPSGGAQEKTTGEAFILQGFDTLEIFPLAAETNTIVFNGNPDETYTLVVIKDAYSRFAYESTLKGLVQQFKNKPLRAELEPALTFVAVPIQDQNYFGMQFDTFGGGHMFTVDFGDGTPPQQWESGITVLVDHYYSQPGRYFVSITGDLTTALLVGNSYGVGDIKRLNLDHLTNLFEFRMEYAPGPAVIDFTHNKQLKEIRIYGTDVVDVDIPSDGMIYLFDFGGNLSLLPESLNEIVDDLYIQVVNSPRSGDFWFSTFENNEEPMVQPSAEAIEKLRILKNTYNWFINPNPDLL